MVVTFPCYLFNFLKMTKQNIITWVLLMVLTVIAGLVSSASISYMIPLVLFLALDREPLRQSCRMRPRWGLKKND
jgi:hypothetical protein